MTDKIKDFANWFKDFTKEQRGWFIIVMIALFLIINKQHTDNKMLQDVIIKCNNDLQTSRNETMQAYNKGQDDAIEKFGEQIKTIQSISNVLKESNEQHEEQLKARKQEIKQKKQLINELDNI